VLAVGKASSACSMQHAACCLLQHQHAATCLASASVLLVTLDIRSASLEFSRADPSDAKPPPPAFPPPKSPLDCPKPQGKSAGFFREVVARPPSTLPLACAAMSADARVARTGEKSECKCPAPKHARARAPGSEPSLFPLKTAAF
jgi:hypothetical protein